MGGGRQDDDAYAVVRLAGELELMSTPDLLDAIEEARPSGRPVVLDLTSVTFADSAALGAMVLAARRHRLAIAAVPGEPLWRLLEVTSLIDVLPVHPTVEDARRALADDRAT